MFSLQKYIFIFFSVEFIKLKRDNKLRNYWKLRNQSKTNKNIISVNSSNYINFNNFLIEIRLIRKKVEFFFYGIF